MRRPPVSRRVLASVWIGVGLVACKPSPPDGVRDVQIEQPGGYHVREGFVRLEPPMHLPTSAPAIDQVEIWIKLPAGGEIELKGARTDPPQLAFPPGTIADRVEFVDTGANRRIVDIRGTTLREDGTQDFHAYRPAGTTPSAPLVGVQWSRDDEALQGPATDHFLARLAAAPPLAQLAEDRRARVLEDIRGKNRCRECHAPARPDNATLDQHGLVNRGTDASGLFTPVTLLSDEGLLEGYGVDDRSTSDPAIALSCGDRPATPAEIGARRCEEGIPMRGALNWAVLWAEDPARAARICEGRQLLWDRLSATARDHFAGALRPCKKTQR